MRDAARALGIGLAADSEAETAFQEWQAAEELCSEMKRKPRELRKMLALFGRVDMQKVLIFAIDNATAGVGPGSRPAPGGRSAAVRMAGVGRQGQRLRHQHPRISSPRVPRPDDGPRAPRGGRSFRGRMPADVRRERRARRSRHAHRQDHGRGAGPERRAPRAGRAGARCLLVARLSHGVRKRRRAARVEVVTKNRVHSVRASRSVIRPSEMTRVRDTVVTNLYLDPSGAPQQLPFDVRINGITPDGRYRLAHIEVRLAAGTLAILGGSDETRRGSFSVFVAAGREFGDASEVTEQTQHVEIPAGLPEPPIVYAFAARIRPDTRRLSIAVRDNTMGEVATNSIPLRHE